MPVISRWLLICFLALLSAVSVAQTQEDEAEDLSIAEVIEAERATQSTLETSKDRKFTPETAETPLVAVLGLSKSMRGGKYDVASHYLDTRYLPEDVAAIDPVELVRALAFVFSQQNALDVTELSDDPEGHPNDGLPSYRDQIGEIEVSNGVVPVYVQRVPGENGGKVWRISNATVAQIPMLWQEHGFSEHALWLADNLPSFTLFGMQNWQVVLMIAAAIIYYFLSGLITQVLCWLHLKIPNRFPNGIRRFWSLPMRLITFVVLLRATITDLGLSVVAKVYLQSSPLKYIAVTILITGLMTLWRDYKIRNLEAIGDVQFIALIKPLVLITKILVFITASLIWADQAGFNVSTLIAGLGVGSLAVALAAQKTLENVIGAATLYAARPIKPGDLCKFGRFVGHVEEIGLRSVTMRTLDRTVVSIPNSMFSSADIENISARDRIRYYRHLQLQMPASNQLRVILGELRALFAAHPMIATGTPSIRLGKIDAATAVIRIDAGIQTRDYQEFLAATEDLNLRIIELVHSNGAIFSGPGQVLQVRDFYQASDDTMAEVNAKLDSWTEESKLPFPDLSDEEKTRLQGSITYPPKGSAQG